MQLTTKKGYLTLFYGHMHVNKVLNPASVCLYKQILLIILNKDKESEILDFSLQSNVSNKVSEYNMQEEQE